MADTIVADLVARLRADTTDFTRGLKTAEDDTRSFSRRMDSLGKSMMSTGLRISAGITLPLAVLGKVSFDAASDLNESLNKVSVVFGENAEAIKKWSEDAATSMGMSRQAALESAGTFGNLFRALGLSIEPSTKMSKKLVGLAADLASFNNASPEDVLLALRSGLVGEAEPLRKFGVSLSEARVESKAYELGLQNLDGSLSDAAKAQARYAIILEDTKLAQGDFARTADGAANKQKILKAQFQDTAAKLGTSLIPIFQQVAAVLQKVAEWFTNLDPKWQKVAVYAALAAAAIGPLVTAFGALATVAGIVASPITLIVIAVAAVAAAMVLMWLKWDEIWTWMKDHPAILLVVSILAAPVAALFLIIGAIKFLYENWSSIWPRIQSIAQGAWSVIEPIYNALNWGLLAIGAGAKWMADTAASAFDGFIASVQGLWRMVDGPLGWLLARLNDIKSAAQWIAAHVPNVSGPGGPSLGEQLDTAGYGSGRRAAGGPVSAGMTYLVGERGPELFTPSVSGGITPNHALGGGGIVVNIYGWVGNDQDLAGKFAAALNRAGGPKISQRAIA